ncbi:MAG: prolyl oligopeptidase family serine peptidase, partial [Pseudomonadota bacterium]
YLSGFAEAMGARGIASFIIDQPGTGEALRRHNMPLEIESEHAAGAAYNFIANDPDIDAGRIAIVGQSLGGYYAPRAAAMDDRFAACIAWAGFYSMQLYYEQENPSADGLPGIMEYAFRAYGVANEKELVEKALKLTLVPVLDKIKVPFLCAHGGNDQQTGPLHATRAVAGAVNSPNAKAHIFTEDEGASEHCGVDNLALVNAYMADWLAQQFAPAA